ncbi:MAG: bifunctional diaminohydroxyphosphoribosylaminopyrimidine deaminase/5-amino-6-(5-phosphoribosylamino)uracil reductase RibD [Flavobacteriales bacterium]|nr:bifunctional diaminohydroxyphosphoribosylaminopyrimidine deaminase/5-amino-6-(5-phosphoribosylamino)uracil reductase RibD [Flavobacteriales bacterium]
MLQKADTKWMQRALDLAEKGSTTTLPNPMVGCVIVLDSKTIAEGYHEKYGEGHAEVNALATIPELSREVLARATAYVTLEPCSHHGKTPPCANLLIDRGIGRVVYAIEDPNPLVSGAGHSLLKDAGLEVVSGVLEEEARLMNRKFLHLQKSDLPYIILKWAQSLDGYMDPEMSAAYGRGGVAITSVDTLRHVHQLRAENSGILIVRKTAEVDNPSLNVREVNGPNPVRIVIDPELRLDDSKLKMIGNDGETWIICKPGVKRHISGAEVKPWLEGDLLVMLRKLRKNGIHSLFVEGGAFTHGKFLEQDLYNEIYVFKGVDEFGDGLKAPLITQYKSGKVCETSVGADALWHYIRG